MRQDEGRDKIYRLLKIIVVNSSKILKTMPLSYVRPGIQQFEQSNDQFNVSLDRICHTDHVIETVPSSSLPLIMLMFFY